MWIWGPNYLVSNWERGYEKMEKDIDVKWYKNPYKRNFMIFACIMGFTIWTLVTFTRIRPQRITSIILIYFVLVILILFIYLAIDNNKYLPHKYGFSSDNLILKYNREIKEFQWKEISNIDTYKVKMNEKLRIIINGKTELIPFLTKKDMGRIIIHFRKVKR